MMMGRRRVPELRVQVVVASRSATTTAAPRRAAAMMRRRAAAQVVIMPVTRREEEDARKRQRQPSEKERRRIAAQARAAVSGAPKEDDRRRSAEEAAEEKASEGVIAQVKLDGDRMQAHVLLLRPRGAEAAGVEVRLFTRNGYDVGELYSDVRDELARVCAAVAPCILDGELLVVDAHSGAPLPWDNAKWRYNNGAFGAEEGADAEEGAEEGADAEEGEKEEGEGLLALAYSEATANARGWEDADDGENAVRVVPLSTAARWRGQGRPARRIRAPGGARLRLVVFDALMLRGEDLAAQPCEARLARLEALRAAFAGARHVDVIAPARRVATAAALVALMRDAVRDRQEGLVLKDPAAPYAFERSARMQKVKLAGPDINAGVVGLGFTLSGDPRRWGLATCILRGDAQEGEYYCRTESVEGDAPHRAFEIAYALHSRVPLPAAFLQRATTTGGAPRREEAINIVVSLAPFYEVHFFHAAAEGGAAAAVKIEWVPLHAAMRGGVVRIPRSVLASGDLQWLCCPWECPFALSLHGDLRALEGSVPRHPVARVEWVRMQASPAWDTRESAARKFEAAQTLATCVEQHVLRRIYRMRALPPSRKRLEEIGRTLRGWVSSSSVSVVAGGAEENDEGGERWPQLPPGGFVTIHGLSTEIEGARAKVLPDADDAWTRSVFRRLSPEERQAMADLPARSQWRAFDGAQQREKKPPSSSTLQTEEEVARAALHNSQARMRACVARA